jgi:hypothetical protein
MTDQYFETAFATAARYKTCSPMCLKTADSARAEGEWTLRQFCGHSGATAK